MIKDTQTIQRLDILRIGIVSKKEIHHQFLVSIVNSHQSLPNQRNGFEFGFKIDKICESG